MLQSLLNLDHELFIFLNTTIANPFFDLVMPIITNEKVWGVPLFLIWLGMIIFGGKQGRVIALLLFLAVGLTDLLSAQVLKPFVGRIRPSHELEGIRLLIGKGGKFSFPSNHAGNITAGMIILTYFFRRWWPCFLIIALLVSFSRIYVGVHYPLDVLGGIVFGSAISIMVIVFYVLLNNHIRKRRVPQL